MNYIIRMARENDCNELSELKYKVWQTTYRGIYPDYKFYNFDYEKNANSFKRIVNNPEIQLFVVEDKGKIIGYMDFGAPFRPFKDYKQEIGLLYVLKEYQGKGIGRKLFNLAYESIKKNGFNEFFISCNKYNISAQTFYEKMGGEVIHIDDDNEDKSIPQIKYLYKIGSR